MDETIKEIYESLERIQAISRGFIEMAKETEKFIEGDIKWKEEGTRKYTRLT